METEPVLLEKIKLEMVYDRNSIIEVEYFSDNTIEIQCPFEMDYLQLDEKGTDALSFFLRRSKIQSAVEKGSESDKYSRHLKFIGGHIERLIQDDGFRVELNEAGTTGFLRKGKEYLSFAIHNDDQE